MLLGIIEHPYWVTMKFYTIKYSKYKNISKLRQLYIKILVFALTLRTSLMKFKWQCFKYPPNELEVFTDFSESNYIY